MNQNNVRTVYVFSIMGLKLLGILKFAFKFHRPYSCQMFHVSRVIFHLSHVTNATNGQKVNRSRKKGQKNVKQKTSERLDQMEQENGW